MVYDCDQRRRGAGILPIQRLAEGEAQDVALMDVQLAGELNGIQTAIAMRREFPRFPVVFYSIQDDEAFYRDFRRSGILSHYAYVRKSNYLLPEMIVPLLRDAALGARFYRPGNRGAGAGSAPKRRAVAHGAAGAKRAGRGKAAGGRA